MDVKMLPYSFMRNATGDRALKEEDRKKNDSKKGAKKTWMGGILQEQATSGVTRQLVRVLTTSILSKKKKKGTPSKPKRHTTPSQAKS